MSKILKRFVAKVKTTFRHLFYPKEKGRRNPLGRVINFSLIVCSNDNIFRKMLIYIKFDINFKLFSILCNSPFFSSSSSP